MVAATPQDVTAKSVEALRSLHLRSASALSGVGALDDPDRIAAEQ
jgi:hypothetical protein